MRWTASSRPGARNLLYLKHARRRPCQRLGRPPFLGRVRGEAPPDDGTVHWIWWEAGGRAGVALEWIQGNWSSGPGGGGPEGDEVGSGSESGLGSGYGGGSGEWAEGGAMLSVIWETEGLQTVGIVVLVFASIKLLHLLGLISFSEGKL
uniref:Uncharacterized protein n=1 Tax=Knipowitschia caucasica TaxID=637954 RepID=A0AAV2KMQ0_KNICA